MVTDARRHVAEVGGETDLNSLRAKCEADRIGSVVIGAGTSGHGFKFGPLLGSVLADLAAETPPPVPLERFSARRAAVAGT